MNPFELYGVKEVADVMCFELNSDGTFGKPALVFDTLKISTPEVASESTQQKGGKGNPTLLDWSYGKDITVTLQDALVSMRNLSTILGGDEIQHDVEKPVWKTEEATVVMATTNKTLTLRYAPIASSIQILGFPEAEATATGNVATIVDTGILEGDIVKVVYQTAVTANKSYEIVIGPKKFPGYYAMVGDTVIRRKSDGVDEGFQFIMPKVKFNTQASLTFESEGDAAVFDIEVMVMQAANKSQMSLVKYDITEEDIDPVSNLNAFVPGA